MNTGRSTLLDGTLVRERRLELGLSERKLTAQLGAGFSQTVLRGIEAGTNHADLTLGDVRRLAALLDLPMSRLLHATTAEDQPPAQVGPPTSHEHMNRAVQLVAAVLVEIDRAIPEQVLAEVAQVSLDEVADVLAELNARLRPAGLGLRRVNREVRIRALEGAQDRDLALVAWRRHLGRRGLDIGQARILQKVLRGQSVKNTSNDERVRGASLVNAGILVRTASGGFALAKDVELSLGIAQGPDRRTKGQPDEVVRGP